MREKHYRVEMAVTMISNALESLTPEERKEVIEKITPPPLTVADALARTNGNISKTAQLLKCHRRNVQAEMRKMGLPPGRKGRKPRQLG